MKKYIIIEADTNDGDYITERSEISDEQIEKFKVILGKLPRMEIYGGGFSSDIRWESGEMGDTQEELVEEGILTEDEAEWFSQYLPYGEYGIHTIQSIDILVVAEEINLL